LFSVKKKTLSPEDAARRRHSSDREHDNTKENVSMEIDDELDDLDNDLVRAATVPDNSGSSSSYCSLDNDESPKKNRSPREQGSRTKQETAKMRATPSKSSIVLESVQQAKESPGQQRSSRLLDKVDQSPTKKSSRVVTMDTSNSPDQGEARRDISVAAKTTSDSPVITRRTPSKLPSVASLIMDTTEQSEASTDEETPSAQNDSRPSRKRTRKDSDADVAPLVSKRSTLHRDVVRCNQDSLSDIETMPTSDEDRGPTPKSRGKPLRSNSKAGDQDTVNETSPLHKGEQMNIC
jgi:hypothetical protein